MKRGKNSTSSLSSMKTDASNKAEAASRLSSLGSNSSSTSSHASSNSTRTSPASDAPSNTSAVVSKSQHGPFEALRQAFLEPMNKQKQQKDRSKEMNSSPFSRDVHSPFGKLQKTDPYEFNVKNEDKGSVVSSNKKIKSSKVSLNLIYTVKLSQFYM